MKKWNYITPAIILLAVGIYYLPGIFERPESSPAEPVKPVQLPQRVVCVNPAATEIIFALGREDKLIAVSDYCDYPAATSDFPHVGGALNPNFERISVLEPDLIIIQGQADEISEYCRLKQIDCMSVNLRDLKEIYSEIPRLGQRLGCAEVAQKLADNIWAELEKVKSETSSVSQKKVFFSMYRTAGSLAGITTIGPGTLINELIEIAGGTNIFADLDQSYPVISKETLLKRQPDIIIESYSSDAGGLPGNEQVLRDWSKLDMLNAAKDKKVYVVDGDVVLKPGPRITQAAQILARIIHPELYGEQE